MRVNLLGMVQSATGPYGGFAAHLKLVTRKDGQVLVVPRKRSMTGAQTHPMMAWSQINWILVDFLWKAQPQRIRVEWGKCTKRTTDLKTSNLDMFRKVNMPRAMLGFPLLRLPPDRFYSWATYLERPPQFSRHNRRPPQQVWLEGRQKPEPPWRPDPLEPVDPFHGGPPPDPAPFGLFRGPIPNPLIDGASCASAECPTNPLYCWDQLTCMPPVDFVTDPRKNYLHWLAYTNPEGTERNPVWDIKTAIHSLRKWYNQVPYETIEATNVECRTEPWLAHPLPWQRAWCVRLKHQSNPGVLLSYGYYWQDTAQTCPGDTFYLAWTVQIYGFYPWPETITLQQHGDREGDVPCCPDIYQVFYFDEYPSGFYIDTTYPQNWAGMTWMIDGNRTARLLDFWSTGPAWCYGSDINCTDTGEHAGHWHFWIVVKHGRREYGVTYRKAVTAENPGVFGLYIKYDPHGKQHWAAWAIRVSDNMHDWNDDVPTIQQIAFQELANLAATILVSAVVGLYWERYVATFMAMTPYDEMLFYKAANACVGMPNSIQAGTWKCRLHQKIGDNGMRGREIAKEAIRRLRLYEALAKP